MAARYSKWLTDDDKHVYTFVCKQRLKDFLSQCFSELLDLKTTQVNVPKSNFKSLQSGDNLFFIIKLAQRLPQEGQEVQRKLKLCPISTLNTKENNILCTQVHNMKNIFQGFGISTGKKHLASLQ